MAGGLSRNTMRVKPDRSQSAWGETSMAEARFLFERVNRFTSNLSAPLYFERVE